MKKFAKISKVRKELRKSSELMRSSMEKVTGGVEFSSASDPIAISSPIIIVSSRCPYLNVLYQCPYINALYSCPWNNQCQAVSLYSTPTCITQIEQNDDSTATSKL